MNKNITVEEILKATNGTLIYGNKLEECESFSKNTKEIKDGEIIEQENKNKIIKLNELKEILEGYKNIKEKRKKPKSSVLIGTFFFL